MNDTLTQAAERFTRETGSHTMTVLHDDGLYRHLRFAGPDDPFYWFDLITWPGVLAFHGGVGDGYMFSRVEDMLTFFRRQNVNPGYWAEKVVDGRDRCKRYSPEKFRALVADEVKQCEDTFPGLTAAVEAALTDDYNWEYHEGAQEFLRDFRYATDEGAEEIAAARAVWGRTHSNDDWKIFQQVENRNTFEFSDWQEWRLDDWHWAYLWACHAIVAGIAQYDQHKGAKPAEIVVELPEEAVAV